MITAPTCRNPECPEKDVPKPYFPPPAARSAFEIDLSNIVWFCGECGQQCEVDEVDESQFVNPFEVT